MSTRIYVKKVEVIDNSPKLGYRRRYTNNENNIEYNTEIRTKPKIEIDGNTVTVTQKRYFRKVINTDQNDNEDQNEEKTEKKIVVNTSGFGRRKKY